MSNCLWEPNSGGQHPSRELPGAVKDFPRGCFCLETEQLAAYKLPRRKKWGEIGA